MSNSVMIPAGLSRELLGHIVDEVFDCAIEDTGVIEEIYACIVKYGAAPAQQEPQPDHAEALAAALEIELERGDGEFRNCCCSKYGKLHKDFCEGNSVLEAYYASKKGQK